MGQMLLSASFTLSGISLRVYPFMGGGETEDASVKGIFWKSSILSRVSRHIVRELPVVRITPGSKVQTQRASILEFWNWDTSIVIFLTVSLGCPCNRQGKATPFIG